MWRSKQRTAASENGVAAIMAASSIISMAAIMEKWRQAAAYRHGVAASIGSGENEKQRIQRKQSRKWQHENNGA